MWGSRRVVLHVVCHVHVSRLLGGRRVVWPVVVFHVVAPLVVVGLAAVDVRSRRRPVRAV